MATIAVSAFVGLVVVELPPRIYSMKYIDLNSIPHDNMNLWARSRNFFVVCFQIVL